MTVKVVRLIVNTYGSNDAAEKDRGYRQPDGLRQWSLRPGHTNTMRIITLHRGGWLRSLWAAFKEARSDSGGDMGD